MRLTARVDYAVRAVVRLAAVPPGEWLKAARLASDTGIPLEYLETILRELRLGGIVRALRGTDGGYALARPPETLTIGDVVTAVDGAPVTRERVPQDTVAQVWAALDTATRGLLGAVTVAEVARGELPLFARRLLEPDAAP